MGYNENGGNLQLADIKATFREILACDSSGNIYHCDLNYSTSLKPYSSHLSSQIGPAHKLQLGRSNHLFIETILNPSLSEIGEVEDEMMTLSENSV